MKPRTLTVALCITAAAAIAGPARAQTQSVDTTKASPASRAAMDSAFAQARRLVIAGQTAAGRHIADSILAATPPGTPAYGSALYGRASLAPTAADAERDYQRIVVEYPLSPRSGDALLKLAQIERSEGDRGSAINHLQRFLRENPASDNRAQPQFWLAQLLFEQNSDLVACGVLDSARAALKPGNIELQNQMDFYTTRCQAAVARAVADSTARVDSLRADSVAKEKAAKEAEAARNRARTRAATESKHGTSEAKKPAAKSEQPSGKNDATRGRYSVQVGAYGTAREAQAAVDRLHGRGIEARVDGTEKPFRVRVGYYATRAEATQALVEFKKLGLDGFVTSIDAR